LYFLDDLLVIFGGNKATIPYARDYLRIILWGSIFQHLSFSLSAQMRAEGNAKKGMYTILIGAVTNIILDPIFIFVFKMGIKGAAIATILSMMAGSAYVLWHFIGGLGTLRLRWCNLRPHPKMLVRIVSIGMAPCCIQIASCAINIFANRCFNTCSATPELANQGIACWSIVTTLQFVFITPIFGLAQGIQPIVGFNIGAQNWLRVRKTYQTALITGLILSGCGAIIVSVSAPYLVRCFTNNDAIISMGSHGLRVLMVTFTLIAVDILNVHYFQSVGKAFISLLLSLQRQLIFFLPSILLLSHFAGIEYIWWSLPIADVVAFMVSGNIAVQVLRRLKKKGQESISISVSGLSENPAEGKK